MISRVGIYTSENCVWKWIGEVNNNNAWLSATILCLKWMVPYVLSDICLFQQL
jgi:hypothetical protein